MQTLQEEQLWFHVFQGQQKKRLSSSAVQVPRSHYSGGRKGWVTTQDGNRPCDPGFA